MVTDGLWEVYCVGVCVGWVARVRVWFCVGVGCGCFGVWCGWVVILSPSSSASLSLVGSGSDFVGVCLSVWRWILVSWRLCKLREGQNVGDTCNDVRLVIGGQFYGPRDKQP